MVTNKRAANSWRHKAMVGARILTHQVLNQFTLADTHPYNSTLVYFIKERSNETLNISTFLSYAKISTDVSHYPASSNTTHGYAYQKEFKGMLAEWATQQSVHTAALGVRIELCGWAAKEFVTPGHTCWTYPTNNADMPLFQVTLYYIEMEKNLVGSLYNKWLTVQAKKELAI
ncbi:hypothetical protein DSO57_1031637 [Entomophthora muscae]|uniref:Uncharacterized protein n=1 Tax=Entomophthora muscae TaxID=34485 RepID=A0ACC2UKY1_9FUNG|nr:hypothetical protein DSO57_1031637 [Entomophthora muscae]